MFEPQAYGELGVVGLILGDLSLTGKPDFHLALHRTTDSRPQNSNDEVGSRRHGGDEEVYLYFIGMLQEAIQSGCALSFGECLEP